MLLTQLQEVRQRSEALIQPLIPEDLNLQGMADASPPKWHLAHTNWFFETFLLQPHLRDIRPAIPCWSYQFNLYYDAVGDRHPRPQRGLPSRPTITTILDWRHRQWTTACSSCWSHPQESWIQLANWAFSTNSSIRSCC